GFDGTIDNRAVAFSPDGRLLAAKGGKLLRVWRTDTWTEAAPAPLPVEDNFNGNDAVVFSPNGSTLATRAPDAAGRRGVTFWETKTWMPTNFLPNTQGPPNWYSTLGTVLAYSTDGEVLAVSDSDELQIRDARNPQNVITNLLRHPLDSNRVTGVA